jgi:hypothetical protein
MLKFQIRPSPTNPVTLAEFGETHYPLLSAALLFFFRNHGSRGHQPESSGDRARSNADARELKQTTPFLNSVIKKRAFRFRPRISRGASQ